MALQTMLVEFTGIDDPNCEGAACSDRIVLGLEVIPSEASAHRDHTGNRLACVLGLKPDVRGDLSVGLSAQSMKTGVAVPSHEAHLHSALPNRWGEL